MPIVELFRKQGKCVEIDTSQKRDVVYGIVKSKLAPMTESLAALPLSDRSQIVLGLKPWPKRPPKKGVLWQAKAAALLSGALPLRPTRRVCHRVCQGSCRASGG